MKSPRHSEKLHTLRFFVPAMALLLSACAKINDGTMHLLASPETAWAIVGEQVLSGKVVLFTDRSATLRLQTDDEHSLSCMGSLRYTATGSGAGQLRCSDGTQVDLQFTALTETNGYGRSTEAGLASFTYGLDPDRARAWLIAPPGKHITLKDHRLALE